MALAERMKSLRDEKKLSVAQLAELSGVSKPYIWQIEKGRRKNPSGDMLRKLASALGTTVAELMDAPTGIPEDALRDVPLSLQEFANQRGEACGLRQEDLEVLRHVHYRGRRPEAVEDWELIFLFLRRILG